MPGNIGRSPKIENLVPSLTGSEQRQCRRTQLAKVKNWLREMPPEEVVGVLGVPYGSLEDYPDMAAVQKQLRWSERHVSQQLYRLRVLGSLHHGMQRLGVG
ncbi:MAG: hypothetical protein HC919_05665 [Oscillatoriales cyanobacterium SM2_2_1]|nr:hypothetical protein [Oscillatoriales cyanobacterium SM2_2_1]